MICLHLQRLVREQGTLWALEAEAGETKRANEQQKRIKKSERRARREEMKGGGSLVHEPMLMRSIV
jgi:hypothetical protein